MPINVIFSNSPNQLLTGLKNRLFLYERGIFDPFHLVVSSSLVKEWIYRELAHHPDVSIACGMNVHTFSSFFSNLFQAPGTFELALSGYDYLSRSEENSLHESAKASFAFEMAKKLLEYGEHSSFPFERWKKNSPPSLLQSWAHALPEEWKLPAENEASLPLRFSQMGSELHFFCVDYFSPAKLHLLKKLSAVCPIFLWVFSPTRMFLGELKGGKEKERWLAKAARCDDSKLERLEALFEGNFDFLGHHAKLLREEFNALEDLASSFEQWYEKPKWLSQFASYEGHLLEGLETSLESSPTPTLLEAFQADLLLQRDPSFEKISLSTEDKTIQIHAAPNPEREVEALYEVLEECMAQEKVLPHEVTVCVSDMNAYAPYIEKVFQDPARSLKGQIILSNGSGEEAPLRLMLRLIDFGQSRWRIEDLFDLLEDKAFNSGLSGGEIRLLRELFLKCGGTWGVNSAHRKKVFPEIRTEEEGLGSLEETLKIALLQYAYKISPETFLEGLNNNHLFEGAWPLTLSEPLSTLIDLINNLKEDLLNLADEQEQDLFFWGSLILKIKEKYLRFESNEEKTLELEIHQWPKFCQTLPPALVKTRMPLAAFKTFWSEFLNRRAVHGPALDSSKIKFTPLLPFKAMDSKVLALLGMNQGDFPSQPQNLPALNPRPEEFSPEKSDFEKASFLATFHLAKKNWIATYHEMGGGASESLLELIKALDERFTLGNNTPSEKIHYKHPPLPFDPPYFLPESSLPNRSHRNYQLSTLTREKECRGFSPLAIDFGQQSTPSLPSCLALKDLKQAFAHPLRYYLNEQLGIYLKNKSSPEGIFAEFEEKTSGSYEWLLWALNQPIEKVIALAAEKGFFPAPPFKELSKDKLRKKLKEQLALFHQASIDPSQVFEMEWVAYLDSPRQLSANKWELPAPQINYRGATLHITGSTPFAFEGGLLLLKENKPKDLFASLPEIKLFHETFLFNKEVFFLKSEIKKPSLLNLSWDALLDHYFNIVRGPVPLLPAWIEPMAEGNEEALKLKLRESWETDPISHDPYLEWAFASKNMIEISRMWKEWKEPAQKLYEVYATF